MTDKAERLRALNDQLRTTFIGGAVMITQGVEAIPIPRRKLILCVADRQFIDAVG